MNTQTENILFVSVIFYGVWCFVNGMIAGEKGRNVFAAFFGSIVISPFLMWAYLVAVPSISKKAPNT